MSKMREEFEEWARKRSLDLEYRNVPNIGQFYQCSRTLLAQEAWEAACANRLEADQDIEDFFVDYNSAMNNPAPLDDGGTSAQELEDLLHRAALLLEKLA